MMTAYLLLLTMMTIITKISEPLYDDGWGRINMERLGWMEGSLWDDA